MVDGTTTSKALGAQSNEPLTWEKQKNLEFRLQAIRHGKRFAMGFLILLVLSLVFKFSGHDLEEDVSLLGYRISMLSFLISIWIVLFTLFLSHAVPMGVLMFINRFLIQMKDTAPETTHIPEEVVAAAALVAGTEEGVEGGTEIQAPGEPPADADGAGISDKPSADDDGTGTPDTGDTTATLDSVSTDDKKDKVDEKRDKVDEKRDKVDEKRDKVDEKHDRKQEEEERTRSKLAIIPLITSLKPDSDVPEGKAAEHCQNLLYSFIRYIIIIIGFTYAFFALGIDLKHTIDILGEDITAGTMLEIILTILVTAIFLLFFLPPFLNLSVNVLLRNYAKRTDVTEDRVRRMRNEVDKIRPGLQKTIAFFIIFFAAIHALSLIDCTPTEYTYIDSGGYDEHGSPIYRTVEEDSTTLCGYVQTADTLLRCFAVLTAALLLTTITPLLIYMFSRVPEGDLKKTGAYRAGRYLNYITLLFALFIIMNILDLDLSESVALGDTRITIWSIISALVVIVFSNVLAKVVTSILRDTALNPKQIDEHASLVMEHIIHIVIMGIGIFIAFGILGLNVLALATGLGLLGFALAFGMQDTIANFMAGIMIAIERPFKIGDRIRVGDEWGDVLDIGLRSTKIRTAKNETVIIPNNLVATREVWNFTKDSPVVANVIPIGISYDSDPVLAEKIILEEAEKHSGVIDRPRPVVRMKPYGDSSIDLELWAWVANARQMYAIRSDLLKSIKQRFNEEGVEIPFPHRTLTFRKGMAEDLARALKK